MNQIDGNLHKTLSQMVVKLQLESTFSKAILSNAHTTYYYILSLKILTGFSSVCYQTTQIAGDVGGTGTGNWYKSTFLEPRGRTKTSSIWKLEGKPQRFPSIHRLYFGQFYSIQMNYRKDFLETVYIEVFTRNGKMNGHQLNHRCP